MLRKNLMILRAGLGMIIRKPLFKKYYNLALKYALYVMKNNYLIKNDETIKCIDGSETRIPLYAIGMIIHAMQSAVSTALIAETIP